MSKFSGRALDLIIRSRSSVVSRFSLARLFVAVSKRFVKHAKHSNLLLTDFETRPGLDAGSVLEFRELVFRGELRLDALDGQTRS